MKLKLDENIGRRGIALLQVAGHDVETVGTQRLQGASDRHLISICAREKRCVVTLDLDFSNPLIFNPLDYEGIVVLRLPARPAIQDLLTTIQTLIRGLDKQAVRGKLWIVQRDRIREYQPEG